jgi:glycine hydroxymethyltransferase
MSLLTTDPEVAELIRDEEGRQANSLSLVASESFCTESTLAAGASIFANKNASGYPGRRNAAGCEVADRLERLAVARARQLFGAEHANVQPYSGTIANIAVFRGLLALGDPVLAMDFRAGGHHSHGGSGHLSGQDYRVATYGATGDNGCIDYAAVRRQAQEIRPHLIVAGGMAYPRAIDFASFGEIARGVGAYMLADIAHIAGLIAAGLHQSPIPYADAVTSSTHKTLGGPRAGGLILSRATVMDQIDAALVPGLQGAPAMHIIAARAVLFKEAARPEFVTLQRRVLLNARAMAEEFVRGSIHLLTGGTDTHLMVADVGAWGLTAEEAERRLSASGITASRVALPSDARRAGDEHGIRLGSLSVTMRGLGDRACGEISNHHKFLCVADRDLDPVRAAVAGPVEAPFALHDGTFQAHRGAGLH